MDERLIPTEALLVRSLQYRQVLDRLCPGCLEDDGIAIRDGVWRHSPTGSACPASSARHGYFETEKELERLWNRT